MIVELLGAMAWDPGFRGLLTVVLSMVILCGSAWLIVGTNTGPRLGFLIAGAGLFGWFAVMGFVWAMYGIGWVGDSPTWESVDTVVGDPSHSAHELGREIPLPDELPDPVALRDADEELLTLFPADQRAPSLNDLVGADPSLRELMEENTGSWSILDTASPYTGEVQSAAAEVIGSGGQDLFGDRGYAVVGTFLAGGEEPRDDDSIVSRVIYRATFPLRLRHDPFVAAVQVQPLITQTAKPGQAPPSPVIDTDAPIHTLIFERDRGTVRLPAITFTIFSTIVFGVFANALHRRDKIALAQRAATAGAA